VTEGFGEIKTLVRAIQVSSQEQDGGVDQISKAINQMEQRTQKSAANAEESAAATEELTAQSHTLQEIADQLSLMVGTAESGRVSRSKSIAPPRSRNSQRPASYRTRPTTSAPTGISTLGSHRIV
jgi:methyl-accepting chemotaxis protein